MGQGDDSKKNEEERREFIGSLEIHFKYQISAERPHVAFANSDTRVKASARVDRDIQTVHLKQFG